MRLKKDQIEKISQKILKDLQAKKLVTVKVDPAIVLSRIQKSISDDMAAEDKLDEDVKNMMDQYRRRMDFGNMNERDLFQKIKKQLAQERKMVL